MAKIDKFAPKKQLLGEILVERNVCHQKAIDSAIIFQRKNKGFLGEHLIRLGYVKERDVVAALVVQNNFPYIAVDKYEVEKDVTNLVSRDTAREMHLIPLNRMGNILSVVMADPLDFTTKQKLQQITNCRISPFIATREEINNAIDRNYVKDF